MITILSLFVTTLIIIIQENKAILFCFALDALESVYTCQRGGIAVITMAIEISAAQ